MRFDDMLATVLAQPAASAAARIAKWRQLVDLVAQRAFHLPPEQLQAALVYLRAHRGEIDPLLRREIAASLAGRRVAPVLVLFFGEDQPSVASPVIATVRLEPREWLELLPSLGMTARGLLRHRRDLDPAVAQALNAFGPSDFILAGVVAVEEGSDDDEFLNPAGEAGDTQIRELVARIEAYRQGKASSSRPPGGLDRVESFRWETGPDGVVVWVEGAPRGPLVGQTVAYAAPGAQHGVDGHAAGAFERRSAFRDARLVVAGSGVASGDWRISGVPIFDQRRGAFLGYRGTARRPRPDEVASVIEASPADGLFGTELPAEALRQLVHELRTPLNAIVGFAEMIDGQYMGPAGTEYRTRARHIIDQAARLLTAVDDLDTAARLETRRMVLEAAATDTAELLRTLSESYARVAALRHARIALDLASGLPPSKVDAASVERMAARLLAATIGLAEEGETIAGTLALSAGAQPMLRFAIDRPQAIAGMAETTLLDPGYSPEGDWPGAPALGLGFALRLVRNLAEAAGGSLEIGEGQFSLYLPAQESAERSSGQGS